MYTEAMDEEEIQQELDQTFEDLGHKEGEYPFEGTWRTDGVTSDMVITFCKRFNINCVCLDAKHRIVGSHKAASISGERLANVNYYRAR